MNPFTHAHSFETPCLNMCSIVMYQKLPRSADQSLPLNTFSWQEAVSAAVCRIRVW